MTDIERIEQRLSAVERTVVDGDHKLNDVARLAELADDVEGIDDRLDQLEERVAELEGISAAMDGYVDNIRSVNESVERQAGAAYAAVDRLEERVDELEHSMDGGSTEAAGPPSPAEASASDGAPEKSTARDDAGPRTGGGHANVEQTVDDIVASSKGSAADGDDGGWVSKLTGSVLGDGSDGESTASRSRPPSGGPFDGDPSDGSAASEGDQRTAVAEAGQDDVSKRLSGTEDMATSGTDRPADDEEESDDSGGFLSSVFS